MTAATYSVLGQVAPTGTAETTLYTVTAGKSAVTSTLSCCNITSGTVKVSVNVRKSADAGSGPGNKHAFMRSASISPGMTGVYTIGMTLASGDVVSVNTDTANGVAVHLYGTEI